MQKYLIKTKHLGLRFITENDIKYLKDLDQDPHVKEYFPEGILDTQEIKQFISESIALCENNNLPCFVIFKLNSEEFVGEAYFGQIDTGEIKVGYLIHKKYWNKGYATEVLNALLVWAKQYIDTEYIVAFADKNNTASFHVMKKCGMTHYMDKNHLDMDCRFYQIKIR